MRVWLVGLSMAVASCGGDSTTAPADAGMSLSRPDAPPRPDTPPGQQRGIRFFGEGGTYGDRVRIPIDDVNSDLPGPRLDVGATDFSVEFWMRAAAADNPNPAIDCGPNNDWVTSNIIIDRDRHSQPFSYGIGIAGGVIVFAITGEYSSYSECATTTVVDEQWHHVAVQRRVSDGEMTIFIDGALEATAAGPEGDVSYPDDGVPLDICPGGLCDYSDPFLVFGAEKHGYSDISYNGYLDEVRISDVLRYTGSFSRPDAPFVTDANTVGLFHFDVGEGSVAYDSAETNDGPNHGELITGGDPSGPAWTAETPF